MNASTEALRARLDSPNNPSRGSFAIVFALATAGVTAAIMQTVVVPLLGQLPDIFSTSPSNTSWVVTTTLLVSAISTPVLGRLGDMFGKKRVMLGCSASMVAGSLLCMFSTSISLMITGRALQGVGMAMIALGVSAMRDLLPAEKLNSSIALMSASLGTGAALGLPLSAFIIQLTNWQTMFAIVSVLSLLVGILILALIPRNDPEGVGTFDYLGGVGLSVGLVTLLLVISKGNDWGWSSPLVVTLACTAVIVLITWGYWQLRAPHPLVNLHLARRRRLMLTNGASIIIGFAMYGQALIAPQLLQAPTSAGGLGQSMLTAGLYMIPGGAMMLLVSPISGRLSTVKGPKVSLVAGACVIAIGYAVGLALMHTPWGLSVTVAIIMTGVALAYGAMPILIMSEVPVSSTAVANGVNTVMRAIGCSVAAAVIGAVLAVSAGTQGFPTETGFRVCLIFSAVTALAAAAVAATIPKNPTEA